MADRVRVRSPQRKTAKLQPKATDSYLVTSAWARITADSPDRVS